MEPNVSPLKRFWSLVLSYGTALLLLILIKYAFKDLWNFLPEFVWLIALFGMGQGILAFVMNEKDEEDADLH